MFACGSKVPDVETEVHRMPSFLYVSGDRERLFQPVRKVEVNFFFFSLGSIRL